MRQEQITMIAAALANAFERVGFEAAVCLEPKSASVLVANAGSGMKPAAGMFGIACGGMCRSEAVICDITLTPWQDGFEIHVIYDKEDGKLANAAQVIPSQVVAAMENSVRAKEVVRIESVGQLLAYLSALLEEIEAARMGEPCQDATPWVTRLAADLERRNFRYACGVSH